MMAVADADADANVYACQQIRVYWLGTPRDNPTSRLWTPWRPTDQQLVQGDGDYHIIVCRHMPALSTDPFIIVDILAHEPAACTRCANDYRDWALHRP